MTRPVDADLHALMDETIGMHAPADTGFIQQIHRDLFDNAGAHAAEYVVGGLPLQDDIVDASTLQELAEEQPGRTGADNDDLSSHFRQNTTRLGAAGLIVLSPPLDEQVSAQLIREQLFPDLDCPSGGLSRQQIQPRKKLPNPRGVPCASFISPAPLSCSPCILLLSTARPPRAAMPPAKRAPPMRCGFAPTSFPTWPG